MKLIESRIIAKAEAVFCNAMSSIMDLATIGKLFREQYKLRLSGEAEFQDLNVVVNNEKIAFRFDYTALAYFSIYMDRAGNFVGMEETLHPSVMEDDNSDPVNSLVETRLIREKESQLADAIADMIERDTLSRLIQIHSHTKLNGRIDFMGARFAVYQNRAVYNLIYQGEIALSFLMDEKGRFLDFAEPPKTSNENEARTKSSASNVFMEIGDLIEKQDQDDFEIVELSGDEVSAPINDEEFIDLENMAIDETDDSEQRRLCKR